MTRCLHWQITSLSSKIILNNHWLPDPQCHIYIHMEHHTYSWLSLCDFFPFLWEELTLLCYINIKLGLWFVVLAKKWEQEWQSEDRSMVFGYNTRFYLLKYTYIFAIKSIRKIYFCFHYTLLHFNIKILLFHEIFYLFPCSKIF